MILFQLNASETVVCKMNIFLGLSVLMFCIMLFCVMPLATLLYLLDIKQWHNRYNNGMVPPTG